MNRLILCIAIVLFNLLGCASAPQATEENYVKKLDSFLNQPVGKVIEKFGIPASEYIVDSTTKLIQYKRSSGTYYQQIYGVTTPITFKCETTFTVKNSIVSSYKYEGNSCRSEDEQAQESK